MARLRYEKGKRIPASEMLKFIRDAGAPTIREIKEYFETDSRAVRRTLGQLMFSEKVNIIVMGGPRGTTYWFEWPKDKRGRPNPKAMREEANKVRQVVEQKRERIREKVKDQIENPEVDFSRDE